MLETSLPGVSTVGDVRSGSVKRVASAVGEGSMAIHMVHRALDGALRSVCLFASSLDSTRRRKDVACYAET